MQVLDLGDEVVLKIQHLEVSAGITEQFNPLDILLMKSDLLEGGQQSIVMLCPLFLEDQQIQDSDVSKKIIIHC